MIGIPFLAAAKADVFRPLPIKVICNFVIKIYIAANPARAGARYNTTID